MTHYCWCCIMAHNRNEEIKEVFEVEELEYPVCKECLDAHSTIELEQLEQTAFYGASFTNDGKLIVH